MNFSLRIICISMTLWTGVGALTGWAADFRTNIGGRTLVRSREHSSSSVPVSMVMEPVAFEEASVLEISPNYQETRFLSEELRHSAGCAECDSCNTGCNACCGGLWFNAELLYWGIEGQQAPILAATGANALAAAQTPTVLFGGGSLEDQWRAGGRAELGLWMTAQQNWALRGTFFSLSESSTDYAIDSNSIGLIARPFTDGPASVGGIGPDAFVVSEAANNITGGISISNDANLIGGDVSIVRPWLAWPTRRVNLVYGYQFSRFDETLGITTSTNDPAIGSIFLEDLFDAENEYHAGHIGVEGEYHYGRWSLETRLKFAFGSMRQRVNISGSTITRDLGGATSSAGSGLFAQTTNVGEYEQNEFAFMNETGIRLAYRPARRLKMTLGYTFMFWSSIARPAEQIDTTVDARLLGGGPILGATPTRPAFGFDTGGMVVHGLNAGLEYRF